jgi:glycosyltransferase involved in cell wall biosynthesis
VVVHLVAQEMMKDLIGPQVIDHMRWQATVAGDDAPRRVAVMFLEPARHAVQGRLRRRVRQLAVRGSPARVCMRSYIDRIGMRLNARRIASSVRRFARGRQVVFHCRGEAAGAWALAVASRVPRCAIVTDVRGAWPEELLYARGFDGPASAPATLLRDYHLSLARLHAVLASSGAVLSVSPGMLEWLGSIGVDAKRLVYVPCCVSDVPRDETIRVRVRNELGIASRFVLSYSGTVNRYQHLEDGVGAFFRAVQAVVPDAHLLCTTSDREALSEALRDSGVDMAQASVMQLPQEQVATYLSAADAGLILRAPSRMNRFSQPTKFAEYLASGVPVIVSEGTGTIPEIVEGACAGVAITCFGLSTPELEDEARAAITRVRAAGETMRRAARSLCESSFLWSHYVPRVRAAYRSALAWPIAT